MQKMKSRDLVDSPEGVFGVFEGLNNDLIEKFGDGIHRINFTILNKEKELRYRLEVVVNEGRASAEAVRQYLDHLENEMLGIKYYDESAVMYAPYTSRSFK